MINNFIIGFRNLWSLRLLHCSRCLSNESKNESGQQDSGATSATSNESDEEYENNIKTKILNESLNFVKEYGWSREAISAGAESINYPGVAHGLFPKEAVDLIQHFNMICNEKLKEEMQKYVNVESDSNVSLKKPELIVEEALRKRLEMIVPFKQQWPQALGIMALPPNVPTALYNMAVLVDNICYYAGERSIDMNWYIRRIGIAGIYKTTELYMIQDNSPDHEKTWEFLNRRIGDAVELNKVSNSLSKLSQPEQIISQTRDAASAIIRTAQNMLGINWRK